MSKESNEVGEEDAVAGKYIILGCGSTGRYVVEYLKEKDGNVLIIELNEARVEDLREEGYHAFHGDIRDFESIEKIKLNEADYFLILSSDMDANRDALQKIRENYSDTTTIVRAADTISKERFEEFGADIVIHPPRLAADKAIRNFERIEMASKAKKLKSKLEEIEDGKLGIFVHTNPDPDSIAGALALQKIGESVGVTSYIIYDGEIGHQENKAFVNLLNIDLIRFEDIRGLDIFDKIALVDAALPGQNNPLPEDFKVDIVIDHHDVGSSNLDSNFVDIRSDVSSTSTIMTKYLQELDITIDKKLATSLLFGIRTDTLEFKRDVNTADLTAANYLYPMSDKELLDRVESLPMGTETLDILGKAINKREIYGAYLVSNIGIATDKDALPQAADYLLKLEGVSTAVVFGIIDDVIQLSARSRDPRVNLGEIVKKAYSNIGSAGGHESMAGAQIPISVFGAIEDEALFMDMINEGMTKRFLSSAGVGPT